jgi:pSer/pThr/pTyr-binding forkhead associated (FHA) protein/type II secretory pathway predicted ATPase ExeA
VPTEGPGLGEAQHNKKERTLFIEQYKLESNPFATDVARPMLESHSVHYASFKLDEVIKRHIQTLFLSGPASVGKTALVRHRLRAIRGISMSWVTSRCETQQQLIHQLLTDLGPGNVEGTVDELRKILEVFLRHQAGNGRFSFVVVDGLERISPHVLREVETFAQMRLRQRPLVQLLLLTRNEDLVTNLLPQYQGGPLARAVHQRLTGFTLEEMRVYVHACLRGAGCDWAEELIPDDVMLDIQAFTQGVVGDINAICRLALDAAVEQTPAGNRQPRVTRALLKEAGTYLNLRYDVAAWAKMAEEALSPEAVHLSDPGELKVEAARLIVSSGRRQVAEITLNRPRMVLGRDDSCDISLDSMYVSRYQNLFMETSDGWLLIDLGSTNGCFVNGRRVREHRLRDGDLIAVGQHQIRFSGPPLTGLPGDDPTQTGQTVVQGSPPPASPAAGPSAQERTSRS